MKARSGNFNFSETAPTKVSDMKEGEMIATSDGIYARVGNQVLFESWGVEYIPLSPLQECGVFYEPFLGTGRIPPNGSQWIESDTPGIIAVDNNRFDSGNGS